MPIISLTPRAGSVPWTKVPNKLIDEILPELKDTELRILLVALRSTTGWNREGTAVNLTYRVLVRRTGRQSEAVAAALRSLESKGLIHIRRPKPQPALRFAGNASPEKRTDRQT